MLVDAGCALSAQYDGLWRALNKRACLEDQLTRGGIVSKPPTIGRPVWGATDAVYS